MDGLHLHYLPGISTKEVYMTVDNISTELARALSQLEAAATALKQAEDCGSADVPSEEYFGALREAALFPCATQQEFLRKLEVLYETGAMLWAAQEPEYDNFEFAEIIVAVANYFRGQNCTMAAAAE